MRTSAPSSLPWMTPLCGLGRKQSHPRALRRLCSSASSSQGARAQVFSGGSPCALPPRRSSPARQRRHWHWWRRPGQRAGRQPGRSRSRHSRRSSRCGRRRAGATRRSSPACAPSSPWGRPAGRTWRTRWPLGSGRGPTGCRRCRRCRGPPTPRLPRMRLGRPAAGRRRGMTTKRRAAGAAAKAGAVLRLPRPSGPLPGRPCLTCWRRGQLQAPVQVPRAPGPLASRSGSPSRPRARTRSPRG
mmetsp:Transcript_14324/g.45552  ORF Transcript_14324/g.45552 Transcript_14324/m.45552 type:complete len:243 (+) Transcript_14324:1328-2056(+)